MLDLNTMLNAMFGILDEMPVDKRLAVRVPSKVGARLWRMVIVDIENDQFVKVSGGPFGRACGHDRWVDLETCKEMEGLNHEQEPVRKED